MENLDYLGNEYLGADFSISSFILIVGVVSLLFTFRRQIFFFIYKETDMELFLRQLDEKLKTTYPKLKFDFKYLEKIQDEPNPDAKKYALIDNIINQYEALEFRPKSSNKAISPNMLWSSYAFNSKNVKNRLPEDWLLRKNAVYERDEKTCQKCSKKMQVKDSDILFIKPLEKGGDFYLENMILVCNDCAKIEKYKLDKTQPIKFLEIRKDLYKLVKDDY
jgi:5-methylcytosine-specific restriction endonuclease McrA